MITAHGMPLPMSAWALKSFCLPGGICVSYSGSPELASRAFHQFRQSYPRGGQYAETVGFFERSSADTNNDYIIAFSDAPKLVTIRNGHRTSGLSRTHWIGDKDAFERFREHENRRRGRYEQGRAVNAALFADEMTGSPASDLYSIIRNLVGDRDLPSVGGFVTVLSNRDIGFRFSVYSDILLDWPAALGESEFLQSSDKFDLRASGENDRYSVSQISPGYYNMNAVAFYALKGRLLVAFAEIEESSTACFVFNNVEPERISDTLNEKLGFPFGALCLVMSAREDSVQSIPRPSPDYGLGISLYCEVNTMPKVAPPTLQNEGGAEI